MKLLTKILLMGIAGLLLFSAEAFAGYHNGYHNGHHNDGNHDGNHGYTDDNDTVYTYSFSSNGRISLDHGKAYTWGINASDLQQSGQTITAARLIFENIYDYSWENQNALFVHLLDDADPGVSSSYDGHYHISDYFQENGTDDIKLTQWFNITHDQDNPDTLIYDFTLGDTGTIQLLMDFMSDGSFGFGFDPDCHFLSTGIYLEIQTSKSPSQEPVPEPATMLLFGTGLLGFSGFKRFRKKFL